MNNEVVTSGNRYAVKRQMENRQQENRQSVRKQQAGERATDATGNLMNGLPAKTWNS